MASAQKGTAEAADSNVDIGHTEALLNTGALQSAIFNGANFSSSTPEDRSKLDGFVSAIMDKAAFDPDRFAAEVRRAMTGRAAA